MASKPIVFALANPDPEILPEDVRAVQPGAIVATGAPIIQTRSTTYWFPVHLSRRIGCWCQRNQRADDAGLRRGIAELARASTSFEAAAAYQGEKLRFVLIT